MSDENTQQTSGASAESVPATPDEQSQHESTPDSADARTDDPVREARREAATYRRKLRDVEADRARLAGVVESYQRAAVEQLAEQGPRALASGADLWVAGTDLAAVLDDEGQPDPTKVAAAVSAALQQRPHWRRSPGSADGGAHGAVQERTASWGDVLGRT